MEYKIEVYLPFSALETIKNALFEIGVGDIGKYSNCMNWYPVKSSWTPQLGSQPFIGEVGVVEEAEEIKLEFKCEQSKLEDTIATIRANHPYEEVGMHILPLYEL